MAELPSVAAAAASDPNARRRELGFGAVQVALGVVLIAAGPVLGGPVWVLAWPGLAALWVGLAYLGLGGPGVFGKRAIDGRHGLLAATILLPYVAVAWMLWRLESGLRDEAAFHRAAPGLYLGRRPRRANEVPSDVRVVVDLTTELPRAAPTVSIERYECVPTLDITPPDDASLAALVERLRDEPGPIFVHCAMGHGRAATVAAAILLVRGLAADVDDAEAKLRAVRPGVRLHAGQRAALTRWQARLAALPTGS